MGIKIGQIAWTFIITTVLLAFPYKVQAQEFEGTWSGEIHIQGHSLTLVLHVGGAGESSSIDSPDQGAMGIPAEIKTPSQGVLEAEIPSIGAKLKGKLEGEKLVGTFYQGGMEFPITLERKPVVYARPQTPKPPFPYKVQEVRFPGGAPDVQLAGTLSIPRTEKGVAQPRLLVMVSGSGQQDRDETIVEHRPFAVIADFLSRNGIATLRYDDRGYGESTGSVEQATTHDFMRDAEAALAYARGLNRFSEIGVLGHSEGGSIAFMLAGKKKADFIVTLAAPGLVGRTILSQQILRSEEYEVTPQIEQQLAQMLSTPELQTPWFKFFLSYDPAKDIRSLRCPALIINGTHDTQVYAKSNLTAIRQALPKDAPATIKEYAKLNHLLQKAKTGAVTEYIQIEQTIEENVLKDIAKWINELK